MTLDRCRSRDRRSSSRAPPLLITLLFLSWAALPAEAWGCPENLAPGYTCDGGASDAGTAPDAGLPSNVLGNPIDLITGTKSQSETDLAIDGAPLGFRRHYSSANSDANIGLGYGWRHSYSVTLYATPEGGRQLIDSTGRVVRFAPDSAESPGIYPAYLPTDGHVSGESTDSVWVVPDGRRLAFRGRYLVRIDWPDRRFIALSYRGTALASVSDETGRTLRFEWTPGTLVLPAYSLDEFIAHPGHLAAVVLPDGHRIEYHYDDHRNLAKARFVDDTTRLYRYEDAFWPNHLTGLVERTGTTFATWHYDDEGRAVSSEHAGGVERVTLAFDEPEMPGETGTTRVTDSQGAESVYTWRRDPATGAGLLLEAKGPGCATCPPTGRRYRYDGARLVEATVLDDSGEPNTIRTFTHDERARLTRIDETRFDDDHAPVTRLVERRAYDGHSHRVALLATPSISNDAERTVETRFDAAGLPVEIVERGFTPTFDLDTGTATGYAPIERATSLAWADGRLVSIDGPRDDVDDVTRLEHDGSNRLVAIRPPSSPAILLGDFDADGHPATLRVGERSAWRLTRDANGRVVKIEQGGRSVHYAHDAEGRLVAVTDDDGRVTRVAYDAAGRVERITDDLGRVTTLVRDDESRVVRNSSLDIDGRVIRSIAYLFDADGRLTRSIGERLDANGKALLPRTFEHEHDGAGTLARTVIASTGTSTSVEFDLVQRFATLTEPDETSTRIGFDVSGRDVSLTDARGSTTSYPTDDFGRRVLLDSPDSGRVRYSYDTAGNRTTEERIDGSTIAYRWDAADRLVERRDADGTMTWTWHSASGALAAATDSDSNERFAYDSDARLIRQERDLGGRTYSTAYAYDARGRLLEKTLPDGQRLRHHYYDTGPNRGSLRAITRGRWLGLANETLVGEIDLDGRDGDTGYLTAGGVRTQQRIAPNGELTGIDISDTLTLRYRFNADGRIIGIEENGAASRYGYTSGRLTSASTPHGDTLYRYDAAGNRTSRRKSSADGKIAAETYRYAGTGNQLLETRDDVSGLATTYRYDEAGAPVAIGGLEYTYDTNRRAVAVHRGGELVSTYAYNAFGERVSKTVHARPGATSRITYFLYDGNVLSAEIDEMGAITAQYVYLDGHRPVAKLEGRNVFGIHGDHLGTPRVMTDADGHVVWEASYAPFGQATISVDEVPLPLRLPGQYADAETGTHYNYFRDYDPTTGRYLTSDPIGLSGGTNTYGYVEGNPLASIDVLGLWSISPEQEAELRQQGKGDLLDNARRPSSQPVPKPRPGLAATRVLGSAARVAGLVGLAYTAYEIGYEAARLVDEVVFQPQDYADILAQIHRYDRSYSPPRGPLTSESIRELASDLLDRQYEYVNATRGSCPTDSQLNFDTRWALRLLSPHAALQQPFRSPDGDLFPSREAYNAATFEFDDAGGKFATGLDFREWWTNYGSRGIRIGPNESISRTRNAAFSNAKRSLEIPRTLQPILVLRPGDDHPLARQLRDDNIRLYVFEMPDGRTVFIREDMAASYGSPGGRGDQTTHFNAGSSLNDLPLHHYFLQ